MQCCKQFLKKIFDTKERKSCSLYVCICAYVCVSVFTQNNTLYLYTAIKNTNFLNVNKLNKTFMFVYKTLNLWKTINHISCVNRPMWSLHVYDHINLFQLNLLIIQLSWYAVTVSKHLLKFTTLVITVKVMQLEVFRCTFKGIGKLKMFLLSRHKAQHIRGKQVD